MQPDFENLVAEIPAVLQRMNRWQDRFQQAYQALEKQHERRLRSEASRGLAAYQRAHEDLRQTAIKKAGLDELGHIYALYDRLCLVYLNGSDEQRERLRGSAYRLPWLGSGHYIASRADQIGASSRPAELLRMALAAMSIADWTYYPGNAKERADYPDSEKILSELLEKARDAGLDFLPHLESVAAMSSQNPSKAGPDSPSVGKMMQDYADSQRRT